MPMIEELICKSGSATHLSKLDLSKGFYQVPVEEEDQLKTAFVTPAGIHEYLLVSDVPAMFQWLMDVVLGGLHEFAALYIDDILRSWEQHRGHIRKVLERLKARIDSQTIHMLVGSTDIRILRT